ncbi:tyrosine-type recombinase/integrase [Paraburkholderia sp. BR14261]
MGALDVKHETGEHDARGTTDTGISAARLRRITGEFFQEVAACVEARNPPLAVKLRLASPHWLRHTHASHALGAGVELVAARDNLRHASIATTSTYPHGSDKRRARQVGAAFSRAAPGNSARQ